MPWGWNKNLTKETDERVAKNSLAISKSLKGNKLTPEHIKNMSLSCKGKSPSLKNRESISRKESVSLYWDKIRGTKEYLDRVEKSRLGIRNYWDSIKGTEEYYYKIFKFISNREGRPVGITCGKGGIRKDLNHYFRSRWEANFARVLNYLNIRWEYEIKRLWNNSGTSSYLPDFYLNDLNMFAEVKGWEKDAVIVRTYEVMQDNNLLDNMLVINGPIYKMLSHKYSKLIPEWEYGKKGV